MARVVPLLVCVALLGGCSDAPTDATPTGTVRLFLDAMSRTEADPRALREAYALLSVSTRRSLVERARFAESLGATDLDPWDMLARGRYRQTFTPARGSAGMRATIEGETATVVVTSEGSERRAEVPLVREDGRWRIVLTIPPVRAPEAEE